MFKKISKILMCVLLFSLSLTACNISKQNYSKQNKTQTEQEDNNKTKSKTIANFKVNATEKQGPLVVTVKNVVLKEINLSNKDLKTFKNERPELVEDGNILKTICIYFDIENTSGKTVSIFPDTSALIAFNTQEQIDDKFLLPSDQNFGDMLGNTKKKDCYVVFKVNSNLNDINLLKWKFDAFADDDDTTMFDFYFNINLDKKGEKNNESDIS